MLRKGCLLLTSLLPSLEDLHIAQCTLDASIDIMSDAMPRLKHLDITDDVSVMTDRTKASIDVLADELRTRSPHVVPLVELDGTTVADVSPAFALPGKLYYVLVLPPARAEAPGVRVALLLRR